MKRHIVLVGAAVAILTMLLVILVVVWREPIPARQGTAPSVITGRAGTDAPAPPASAEDPRTVRGSSAAARAQRGSGVEGVPSGGVTLDPPSGN